MRKGASPSGRGRGHDSRLGYLLQDEDVRRWYLNVARGSQITADVYLRRLGNFREDTKLMPKDLVRMNQKALGNCLLDYIGEKEGKVPMPASRAAQVWVQYCAPRPLRVSSQSLS
ncbi:MAG: hypothetical protein M1442_01070 [Candidatus Thermoplasmatota archaeon]|jgi:hypothetical protein|nr:hypothetical protein [Candidatus Thermoplasmatota archaeon]